MLFQVLAFLPLLSVAFGSAIPSSLPAFCHGLDCPLFTVVTSTADYELRRYEATKWVATQTEAATFDAVRSDMFHALFRYIDGNNADNVKIPMTAPVVTTMAHGQGPNCASNFTMHFMLPHDQWQAPVTPSDPRVSIVTLPAMEIYVKSFPGWATDEDKTQKVMELYKALSSDTKTASSVETHYYYTAGYDGPYQFANRHNEVWIQKL
ncbi:heme-binding protein 2-like [Babylonia areolata]|uniref:heme-binding protein 2-like n=1 Tax=Babylonia areolata TaxID=304850 RepID=UPI003FD25DA6